MQEKYKHIYSKTRKERNKEYYTTWR